MPRTTAATFALISAAVLALSAATLEAGEMRRSDPRALAARIDELIDERLGEEGVPASAGAEAGEFVRRAYLDITGRIPSGEAAEAFLADDDPEKRRKLVEELLASPHYGERFGTIWHNLIVRPDANMARPPDSRPLAGWLAEAFNENRPWSEIVAELLTASGSHGENPATLFYTLNGDSRGAPQPNILTGSVSQLFMGLELECAECHDHPFSKWTQEDFWSLAAFFSRVKNSGNKGGKKRTITEEGAPEKPPAIKIPAASFTNVGSEIPPRFLGGEAAEADDSGLLRPALAEWLTSPENGFFAPASANRLWAHFFGRGLVEPLDGFREDSPATHPEVLELLADEFAASGFDRKHLIRVICATRAYQRTSRPRPENADDDALYSHMEPKVLSPEMLLDSLTVALEVGELLSDKRPPNNYGNPLVPDYSPREQFVQLFATKREGDDPRRYTHGVPQLLYLLNQPAFNSGAPVVERLMGETDEPTQVVAGLYLAALARRPSEAELKRALQFVRGQESPRAGYEGVLWTLLTRSEFILNH